MTKAKRTSIRMRAEGVRKRIGRGGRSTNPAQRALDDIKKLVTEAEDRLLGRPEKRQASAKKTAGVRQRNARRRQAAAKQAAGRKRAKSR